MFGGADENATAPVADHQDTVQHDDTISAVNASVAATPVTADTATYDAGTYADDTAATTVAADVPVTADTIQPAAAAIVPAEGGDLLAIKQQALQQLSPLVGHLEQSPEEKFRTTMMMIQASDNPDLIKEAYEAAQQIPDEKIRAQALLDVVNEINYFTQHVEQQQ
jgi:hypothetical protein